MLGGGNSNKRRGRKNRKTYEQQRRENVEEKRQLTGDNMVSEEGRKKKKRSPRKKRENKNACVNGDAPKVNEKKETSAAEAPKRRIVRERQRRVPATNLVSMQLEKINLIRFQLPPYTILAPRFCDRTKMTILKLRNVDSGVDESLLFWAFKEFGWIENIYVVRCSFKNRKTGVAFVGFRRDSEAANAVSQSGTIQFFGRRIFLEIYTNRRKKTHLLMLKRDLLTRIFSYLDWRSRIRCESVCRKFSSTLKQMYQRNSYVTWNGLPENAGFAFVSAPNGEENENYKPVNEGVIKIRVTGDRSSFKKILRSVLFKFYSKIAFLEFHGLEFDSEVVSTINGGGSLLTLVNSPPWDAGSILVNDCMLDHLFIKEWVDFMHYYGDRLTLI